MRSPEALSPGEPVTAWRAAIAGHHLPGLDGLRAVAVFMVVFGHAGLRSAAPDVGVLAFFVLSGFLITWLLLKERAATGTTSLSNFYARRAFRILPAYFAYLAFSFSLDTYLGDMRWKEVLLPSLTYTVNYYNALHGHPSTSVSHLWSLAIEEQFYFLWPMTFIALFVAGPRRVIQFLLGAILVVVTLRSALYYGTDLGPSYVYNAFETRFDSLALGCLLAVAAGTPLLERLVSIVAARWWYSLPAIALLYLVRFHAWSAFHYGPGFTLEALIVAVLMVQIIVWSKASPWRFLNFRAVRYLGALSYAIYLYHGWGRSVGGKVADALGGGELALGVVASILLATGSYHLVERPFLRLKERFAIGKVRATA